MEHFSLKRVWVSLPSQRHVLTAPRPNQALPTQQGWPMEGENDPLPTGLMVSTGHVDLDTEQDSGPWVQLQRWFLDEFPPSLMRQQILKAILFANFRGRKRYPLRWALSPRGWRSGHGQLSEVWFWVGLGFVPLRCV